MGDTDKKKNETVDTAQEKDDENEKKKEEKIDKKGKTNKDGKIKETVTVPKKGITPVKGKQSNIQSTQLYHNNMYHKYNNQWRQFQLWQNYTWWRQNWYWNNNQKNNHMKHHVQGNKDFTNRYYKGKGMKQIPRQTKNDLKKKIGWRRKK